MVNKYLRFTLACAMAVLTAISAQLKFNLGPVPYTMQNFAVILSGLLLGAYGAVAQLIYLGMIAVGLPVGAGFEGGIGVLFGYKAGYLWMFPISALIVGLIRKAVYKQGNKKELFVLWLGSVLAIVPLYICGFIVFYQFASGSAGLMGWCEEVAKRFGLTLDPFWTVFFASVLIFVPQDIFMDHILAIAVFKYLHELLRQRGYDLP